MSTSYQTAFAWGELNSSEWKIIGQFFVPSDPNGQGSWIYLPPSVTDTEISRQRATGHLLTSLSRVDGQLCLLARRPKKKNEAEEYGPKGYKHTASWF